MRLSTSVSFPLLRHSVASGTVWQRLVCSGMDPVEQRFFDALLQRFDHTQSTAEPDTSLAWNSFYSPKDLRPLDLGAAHSDGMHCASALMSDLCFTQPASPHGISLPVSPVMPFGVTSSQLRRESSNEPAALKERLARASASTEAASGGWGLDDVEAPSALQRQLAWSLDCTVKNKRE